ncbi:hypothetical protein [Erwinia sp. 9145]|nr:hypothetical protein [Erwinia sp. 9145]
MMKVLLSMHPAHSLLTLPAGCRLLLAFLLSLILLALTWWTLS